MQNSFLSIFWMKVHTSDWLEIFQLFLSFFYNANCFEIGQGSQVARKGWRRKIFKFQEASDVPEETKEPEDDVSLDDLMSQLKSI